MDNKDSSKERAAAAEKFNTDRIKERLAATQAATEKARKDAQDRLKGKPTPTQEENDRAVLGEHITEHEHDGSAEERDLEHDKRPAGQGYSTRQLGAHTTGAPASREAHSGGPAREAHTGAVHPAAAPKEK